MCFSSFYFLWILFSSPFIFVIVVVIAFVFDQTVLFRALIYVTSKQWQELNKFKVFSRKLHFIPPECTSIFVYYIFMYAFSSFITSDIEYVGPNHVSVISIQMHFFKCIHRIKVILKIECQKRKRMTVVRF